MHAVELCGQEWTLVSLRLWIIFSFNVEDSRPCRIARLEYSDLDSLFCYFLGGPTSSRAYGCQMSRGLLQRGQAGAVRSCQSRVDQGVSQTHKQTGPTNSCLLLLAHTMAAAGNITEIISLLDFPLSGRGRGLAEDRKRAGLPVVQGGQSHE